MPLDLKYQTAAQYIARLRVRYRNSSREGQARIAVRILRHITEGDATDTQMRNAFGLTAAQWTTQKARMQTLADNWNAVQAATGE